MATRITVRLTGALGLDDADLLITRLERETGLGWRAERSTDANVLTGGVAELILFAVVGRAAEMTFEAAVHKARAVVDHFRERRLDPPTVAIETAPAEEPGSDAAPGDPISTGSAN